MDSTYPKADQRVGPAYLEGKQIVRVHAVASNAVEYWIKFDNDGFVVHQVVRVSTQPSGYGFDELVFELVNPVEVK